MNEGLEGGGEKIGFGENQVLDDVTHGDHTRDEICAKMTELIFDVIGVVVTNFPGQVRI